MIRVADGTQIWVEDMLVPQARAAALESELAHRLVVRLGNYDPHQSKPQSVSSVRAENPARREAYELFLRGHHEWQTLQRHRMQDGIQHLSRAIEHDPSLYAAYIDLANASVIQILCGFAAPAEAAEQVRLAADAIPSNVEGAEAILPAMGWVRFHIDRDLAALRALSRRARICRMRLQLHDYAQCSPSAAIAFLKLSHYSTTRFNPIRIRHGLTLVWHGPITWQANRRKALRRQNTLSTFFPTTNAAVSTAP